MCNSAVGGGGITTASQSSSNDSNGSCNSAGINSIPSQLLLDNSQVLQQHLMRHLQQQQQNQQRQQLQQNSQQLLSQNQSGTMNAGPEHYSDSRVVAMGQQHSILHSSDTAGIADSMLGDTFPDELFHPALSVEQAEQKKSDVPPPPKKPLSPYMRFSKAVSWKLYEGLITDVIYFK